MRIITGTAKGTRLETLEGEATRPTSEMAKEALFSMIQFDIEGRTALDLFAGSGQLGLEALSRGAAGAVFVDSSPDAINIIRSNARRAKLYEKCAFSGLDWEAYIRRAAPGGGEKFGLIFIDPPYAEKINAKVLRRLCEADLIADCAMIICESGADEDYEAEGLVTLKKSRYGKAHITLLTKETRQGGEYNEY